MPYPIGIPYQARKVQSVDTDASILMLVEGRLATEALMAGTTVVELA
jgi:hypothetical protein